MVRKPDYRGVLTLFIDVTDDLMNEEKPTSESRRKLGGSLDTINNG
jgi:hypothetical protein